MQDLLNFVSRHKAGDQVGITAVCSAHPVVLEAALSEGARHGSAVLVEATSNQVQSNINLSADPQANSGHKSIRGSSQKIENTAR